MKQSTADRETFTLALTNGEASVRLTLPIPLTEAQWTRVAGILEAVVQPTLGREAGEVEPDSP